MGEVIITLQILPESPETDLEKISETIKGIIEKAGGRFVNKEIEPFVFGLKKLTVKFVYPEKEFNEEKFIEEIENVEGIQSAEIIGITRSVI